MTKSIPILIRLRSMSLKLRPVLLRFGSRPMALGLLSGVLLFASFPPLGFYPLAWVAAVPLLWLAVKKPNEAVVPAFLAGVVFFIPGLEWIRHATFAGMIVLGLYLAVYIATFALAVGFIRKRLPVPMAVIAPVVWVAGEAVRANLLTGFPYLLLGHSQINILPLMQVLDITGVYGVSFIVLSFNGFVADLLASPPERRLKAAILSAAVSLGLIIVALVYGFYRLNTIEMQAGPMMTIIQPNIPQDIKNEYTWELAQNSLELHENLTGQALRELRESHEQDGGNKQLSEKEPLVIWPETALPGRYNVTSEDWTLDLHRRIDALLKHREHPFSHLLSGFATMEFDGERPIPFNSAIFISKAAQQYKRYDKIHLVPFGEYIPLQSLLPFMKTIVPLELPFSAGSEYVLFEFDGFSFGTVICYEDVFPYLIRNFARKGARFIVNISNEGWFYNSAEADQHLDIARCRAIENRVGLVRCTNTGISCLIAPDGRIADMIEQGGRRKLVRGYLSGRVTLGSGATFYTKAGDLLAWLCTAATLALLIGRVVKR